MKIRFPKQPILMALLTSLGLSGAVPAADITLTLPADGGFVIKSDTGQDRFHVQDDGTVLAPDLPGAAPGDALVCHATGRLGPCPAAIGGLSVHGANNVKLGKLMAANDQTVTLLTSTGHMVTLHWSGLMPSTDMYFTGASCTGTAFRKYDGAIPVAPLFGKSVIGSGVHFALQLMVADDASLSSDGTLPLRWRTVVSMHNGFVCAQTATQTLQGWDYKTTSASSVGLPTYPLPAPLQLR